MPRPYPAEFRASAIALVRAGKLQKETADDLGIHPVTLSKWVKQHDIDRLVGAGAPVDRCCVILNVKRQNYDKHKRKPTTAPNYAGNG